MLLNEADTCRNSVLPKLVSILTAGFIAAMLGVPVAAQVVLDASSLSAVAEATINPNVIRVSLTDANDIRFSQISVEAGLSQTRVAHMVRDDLGFMWFGTQYGLNRYDGYKFKVFTPQPGNPNSLSCAFVYSVFKDRSGILWVGCDQFLDRFDPITETFTHIRLEAQASKAPSIVFRVTQDSSGMLWLTTGSGLYELNPQTMRITNHFVHDPQNPRSISSNGVLGSVEDRNGKFWVGDGNYLEQLDRKTGEVKLRVSVGPSPINSFSVFEDRLGIIWIGYMAGGGAGGLAAFDPNTDTLSRYSFYDSATDKAIQTDVHTIFEDSHGTLWLATMGEGLLKFDRAHASAVRYRHRSDDSASLSEDRVIELGEDREGNVWAGLHSKAPNFFSTNPVSFKSSLPTSLNPNGLGESMVSAIYADKQGTVWIGTAATLTRFDRATGKSISYRPPDMGVNTDLIAITEDQAGIIWVGSYGQGLYRFDPRTAKFKIFRRDASDSLRLSNNAIFRILIDHNGAMWLATWNGLDRFDPVTGSFEVHKRDPQSFGEHYYDIAEDSNGELWLGGTAGLQRFDPISGKFTGYQHTIGDTSSISDNDVTSVYIDRSGSVWAATYYGLNKLDRNRGTFAEYFAKDGLPSNDVNCILGDAHGNLWLSTNRGLARFNPVANTFDNYSMADGLSGVDYTKWRTCSQSETGEMFFGGFAGATSFFPDQVSSQSYVPPIVFTDFRLFGNSVGAGAGSPLKRSISFTDNLILLSAENVFSLEFAALNFSHSSMMRYRYKLDGFSPQWIEAAGDQRTVNFSALPAGAYTFRVQTANAHNGWNTPGAMLQIRILPPWWQSPWFRTLCAALIGIMIFALYQYRMGQVRQRFELRLEERLGERTRIAREFHDTLLQTIHGSKLVADQAQENLNDPAKTQWSLQRLSQWLDRAVSEGRAALDSLRGSATETEDLAAALRRAADAEAPGSMRVAVSVIGAVQSMHPIAREEVFRIGEEAIRNACHHSGATTLNVEVRYNSNLALQVLDDGCGLDPALLHRGKPGHFGISGMRERAANIGGRLAFDVSRQKGTCLTLTVPGHLIFNYTAAGKSS
jgi:signal transduction histidine kinase/ligand-binding sensor domain-containing protein